MLCEKTSFDAFFQNAKSDDRWKEELPTELQGCAPALRSANTISVLSIMPTPVSSTPSPEKSGEISLYLYRRKKSDRTLEIADYTRKFTASGQSLPGAA